MHHPLRLNADAGESFGHWSMGQDEQLLPYLDLVNLACGFHAADPDTMRRSVRLAKQHQVGVGAHPGYPDKVGFGRRSLACSADEIENLLLYQLGALDAFCRAEDWPLTYVKPHGALYHDMMQKPAVFEAILRAVNRFNPKLALVLLAVPERQVFSQAAEALGITLWWEAFADRAYTAEGQLADRQQPGAVYHCAEKIRDQAQRLATQQPVPTLDGQWLQLQADLLCVHGDNAESIALVASLRDLIQQAHSTP